MEKPLVNNDFYRTQGHAWWDEDAGEFSTIRYFINPVRSAYFKRILGQKLGPPPARLAVLDVGCGGGLLAEEFGREGFDVTGVDPAPESIAAARAHAALSGLDIRYEVCSGESLCFSDRSFDVVVCCDVLEHVDDVGKVIGEIARVLKPGGLFLYDTINRTLHSKIAVIKVFQEWKSTAFVEPNMHVWEHFITPGELCAQLARHGLETRENRGISTRPNLLANWLDFRRRAKGRISFKELGQRLAFRESEDLRVSYMGYAVKPGP